MMKRMKHQNWFSNIGPARLFFYPITIYLLFSHKDAKSFSLMHKNTFSSVGNPRENLFKTRHFLSKDDSGSGKSAVSKVTRKTSGVYSRPSAAIERGSGFYVPGLEGSRVRSLFGILLAVLCYINHALAGSQNALFSQTLSESITYTFAMLLFVQGLVEFGKESGFVVKSDGGAVDTGSKELTLSSSSSLKLTQISSSTLTDMHVESLQWIAASFISLTPTTHVLLLEGTMSSEQHERSSSSPSVLFQLGNFPLEELIAQEKKNECIHAAIAAAYQSKGGRISIPSTHPAALLIPEEYRRCVLLQRLENVLDAKSFKKYCFLVGSNRLLVTYTKSDLTWLGSLAEYAQLELK